MNKATEALEREHRVIQKVVAVMAQLAAQLELRHTVEGDVLRDLLQFMRAFSEQRHHGKEESYFFPYLEYRKQVDENPNRRGPKRGSKRKAVKPPSASPEASS